MTIPPRRMPESDDYAAAVQRPSSCFINPALRGGTLEPGNVPDQPMGITGNFSIVFPVTASDGSRFAVKCFYYEPSVQMLRYAQLRGRLAAVGFDWVTNFDFQAEGIWVKGIKYPILCMDWVDAACLDTWIETNRRNKAAMTQLAARFDVLLKALRNEGIAHGDLQHGNILIESTGRIRLVDYDGIYFHGLDALNPQELGHPDYQSPYRDHTDYGLSMDNFSAWLISLSLKAIAVDPNLLDQLNPQNIDGDRGEFLLLDRNDFANPGSSFRLAVLSAHPHPSVQELAQRVRQFSTLPVSAIPPLSDERRSGKNPGEKSRAKGLDALFGPIKYPTNSRYTQRDTAQSQSKNPTFTSPLLSEANSSERGQANSSGNSAPTTRSRPQPAPPQKAPIAPSTPATVKSNGAARRWRRRIAFALAAAVTLLVCFVVVTIAIPNREKTTISDYFDAINTHKYDKAWNLGGKNLDTSYDHFVKNVDDSKSHEFLIISRFDDEVTVHLKVTSVEGDIKQYDGYYVVEDGVITSAEMTQD